MWSKKRIAATGAAAATTAALFGAGISVYVGNDTIPGQSCPAYPSFPDASCTGVPSGITLSTYTGANPVTTNGTVIDGKEINACISIKATGVIIRNSYIHYNGDCAGPVLLVDDGQGAYDLTIQDSTIDCGTGFPDGVKGSTGIGSAFITGLRLDISECENGVYVNQHVDIRDSYFHDSFICTEEAPPDGCGTGVVGSNTGSHTDSFQIGGAYFATPGVPASEVDTGSIDVTVIHNTFKAVSKLATQPDTNDTHFANSAITSSNTDAGKTDHNVDIEQNLFSGGGFTLYCQQNGPGDNYDVINNKWSVIYNTNVGIFGPAFSCADETISGNVYLDGANAGNPVDLAGSGD